MLTLKDCAIFTDSLTYQIMDEENEQLERPALWLKVDATNRNRFVISGGIVVETDCSVRCSSLDEQCFCFQNTVEPVIIEFR